jgi:hypothetical protein
MAIQSNFPNLKPTLLLDFANTETLDSRITFTRGTPATYYDGKTTAMAEQNLLLNSETFSSWGKVALSATNNATTAPNGTVTATLLTLNTASSEHYISCVTPLVNNVVYTYSVYAKPNGSNWLVLNHNNATGATFVYFNISTGTVGTTGSGITASMVNAGNGWYRCILTIRHITASHGDNGVQLYIANSSGSTTSFTGDGTSGFYIWGAQLEQRSTATAYTPTTTQPITNYIPVLQSVGGNQARFDHNPTTGESLGLLIEEQRTNIASYSADLGNASAWPQAGITVISNANVAPDGSLTAMRMASGTSSGDHDLYRYFNLDNSPYTLSVYAKYSGAHLALSAGISNPWAGCIFDLQNGVAKTPQGTGMTCTASIQSVGNGWYRCSITYTGTSSYGTYVIISNTNNVNATMGAYGFIAYPGDGWSGTQLWGCQLEQGQFATSYIPTTSASVTRTPDFAQMTGSNFTSWFNQAEGTLYAEQYITNVAAGSINNQAAASLGRDSGNFMAIGHGTGDGGGTGQKSIAWIQANASTQQFMQTGTFITAGLSLKSSLAYQPNNFAYSANNQTLITNNSGYIPVVNNLSIGTYSPGGNYYANGTIRKIAYYPVRVTNAQLQALTA